MSAENSTKPAGKNKVSGLATAYLVLYNVVLCAGCSCNGGCEPMPTVRESVCCKEIQRVVEKMDAYTAEGELGCITSHPGFSRVCLDRWVLETASYQYIQQYGGRARRDASENEWLSVGAMGVRHYLQEGTNVGLYDAIELPLKAFQTAAILEVVHCMIGIVPSSAVLTAFQVTSRLVLLWPVTHSVIEVQNEKSIILYLTAWTITEVIRYAFYVFALLNRLPYVLMWLRYTLFIVLYPIGVTGELWTIYLALPYVKSTGLYSLELPNDYNISFDYYSVLIFLMILYIPIFPRLYSHMLRQRKKLIGGGAPGTKRD